MKCAPVRPADRGRAKIGTDQKSSQGWTAIKVGDALAGGVQLDVPVRSALLLVLEPATPPSVIMVESMTFASIDELALSSESAKTRLGLAYGAIRAGVAEGGLRSDMQIESPVATLSKRGTWDFRFEYERGTGRWSMTLADRGLVEAINRLSGQRQLILPGQAVNQLMARWVQSAQFNRQVQLIPYGLMGKDQQFFYENSDGLGILLRGGGNQVALFGNGGIVGPGNPKNGLARLLGDSSGGQTGQLRLFQALQTRALFGNRQPGTIGSPDGSFGIGFGTVPNGKHK
ncbi:MAG: hypothetical protein U1A27_07275 [Phycisphaerae bacterium]